jgi:hypothetical protein
MARNPLSARISPNIRLEEINIRLSDFGPPTVEMTGRVSTGNRRADMASTVSIKTGFLGPAGQAFLEELRETFSAKAPAVGMPATTKE